MKKKTEDKWKGIIGNIGLTDSKVDWMSQYAGLQTQSITQSILTGQSISHALPDNIYIYWNGFSDKNTETSSS